MSVKQLLIVKNIELDIMKPSKNLTIIGLLLIVISNLGHTEEVAIQPSSPVEPDVSQPAALAPEATNDMSVAKERIEKIKTIYSRYSTDGSVLKNELDEVRIIKPSNTGKEILRQVGLNALLLPLGIGTFSGFGKSDFHGDKIDQGTLQDRTNLTNPIATTYIQALSSQVSESIAKDSVLSAKTFKKPLIVSNGLTRLIYEKLEDSSEKPAQYRLYTELIVYKPNESWFFVGAPKQVNCSQVSKQLLTQPQWALGDYILIKQELDKVLTECQLKVIAELRTLLED